MEDARKSGIRLTRKGQALLRKLRPHWDVTFNAIDRLEAEIGFPLREVLVATATALERSSFADRLQAATAY